jgi:hypothetical protein
MWSQGPEIELIARQFNPLHTLTPHFLKIYIYMTNKRWHREVLVYGIFSNMILNPRHIFEKETRMKTTCNFCNSYEYSVRKVFCSVCRKYSEKFKNQSRHKNLHFPNHTRIWCLPLHIQNNL